VSITIPLNLKKAILEDKVVVFIGAGISISAGLPSWSGIVEKVLQNDSVEKNDAYLNALKAGVLSPLEVLDKLKNKNRIEVYKVFENETSLKAISPIYNHISNISRRIITTNYDELIEHNLKLAAIDPSSIYNLQKIDSANEFLFKIHGSRNAIDHAVIFTDDYEALYSNPNGLAKFQLNKILSSNSCLFLGFSMADNYVCELFDNLSAMYDGLGRKHYAISTSRINHDFVTSILIDDHSQLESALAELGTVSLHTPQLPAYPVIAAIREKSTDIDFPEEGIEIVSGSDAPPKVENWAGRASELRSMSFGHKVCFITGIGGQGKSALASKFLSTLNRDELLYIDWRDFKEEDLNFQTKLYQLVEMVSDGAIKSTSLVGLDTPTLIDHFFSNLGNKKGVFVLDNVDKYINLVDVKPSGDMEVFFERALRANHDSVFIFTCRPFIQYAGVGFYQIRLEGLTLDDTKDLVGQYHNGLTPTQLSQISERLHLCTRGHPLWMGLVLANSRADWTQIYKVLDRVERRTSETGHADSQFISNLLLQEMWDGVKDRERIILRTLSISGIAESAEDLAKIVSKKLNYNQFSKALKALHNLNLIITKGKEGYVELHPLVREFIKSKYGREEQESFISLYVQYLDKFILLIKSKLGKVIDPEEVEPIIKKIEILSQAGKTQEAINELRRVDDSLFLSGYSEDYLRLAEKVLGRITWKKQKISSIAGFMEFMEVFFVKCAEMDRGDLFNTYIAKFNEAFTTPDKNMILARSSLCHYYWVLGRTDEAISAGESASELIEILNEKDIWNARHRLNLSLRDSGNPKHIKRALSFFLDGYTVEEFCSKNDYGIQPENYGNVGRCLDYLGEHSDAILLFCKSYSALNDGTYLGSHNLGYASIWISESLKTKGEYKESFCFKLNAKNIWKDDFPVGANGIHLQEPDPKPGLDYESLASMEAWQIKRFCDSWVETRLSTLTDN